MVTDPRGRRTVVRLIRGERSLGSGRQSEHALFHVRRAHLDHEIAGERSQQGHHDGATVGPVLVGDLARVGRVGEVVGVVALAPQPDEAGLHQRDHVGVLAQDRRQLLDVLENALYRCVAVRDGGRPTGRLRVGEADEHLHTGGAGAAEVGADQGEVGRVERVEARELLQVEDPENLGNALLGPEVAQGGQIQGHVAGAVGAVVRLGVVVEATLLVGDHGVARRVVASDGRPVAVCVGQLGWSE